MQITSSTLSELNKIRERAKSDFRELQSWPSYYDRRFFEFLSYMEVFSKDHLGKVLELGCGIGYQSALLSTLSTEVTATDLADESSETHTPGMKVAMHLLQGLNIENVNFTPCSAENLPFADNSFDTVYSSHVTEHIPDQDKAIREIYRVLKPGGLFLCIVPSSFDKPYSFVNHYFYLLSRIPKLINSRFKSNKKSNSGSDANNSSGNKSDFSGAASLKKSFPFPPPHGAFPDFLTELKEWSPFKWKQKLTNAAPFHLVSQQTTQYLPFMPALGYLSPAIGTGLHGITRKFERDTGSFSVMQFFGINSVLLLQKK